MPRLPLCNCICVHREMRRLIPPNITKTSYSALKAKYDECGLSRALADHVWNTKTLWLICMHPEDLGKVSRGRGR